MTNVTAQKLLSIVSELETMLKEIGEKSSYLNDKLKKCRKTESESIKNAILILGGEMNHINTTIGLVEDLSSHLLKEAA